MARFINRMSQIMWMAVLSALLLSAALFLAVIGLLQLALIFALVGIGAALLNLGPSS